jgi:hypothetical protein
MLTLLPTYCTLQMLNVLIVNKMALPSLCIWSINVNEWNTNYTSNYTSSFGAIRRYMESRSCDVSKYVGLLVHIEKYL